MLPIKFALIGCGRIVKKHVDALQQLRDAKLVAVCDMNTDKAKKIGEEIDVPYYDSYDEMLQNEDIDVVNILTPSGLHALHAIDVVSKYKKHIVVEKPMALKLEDAEKMISVCKENNVRLFEVKQNRYNLPVQQLREAVESEKFGRLVMGTVRVRWSRGQEYYDQDPWRGTWELDGGALTNQASHHVDLLLWMMGEAEEVYAQTATRLVDIEVEDTAAVVVKFKNGALGIIEVTTATRPTDLEGSLSILGEKGSVEIGGFAVNETKIWKFIDSETNNKLISEQPPNVYGFGHVRFLEDVIKDIEYNTHNAVDGEEGYKSLRLLHAIYESSQMNFPVKLDNSQYNHSLLGRKLEESLQ